MAKVSIDAQTLADAMFAISKLQASLGIDLVDEDGFGHVYYAIRQALEEGADVIDGN